ncbi:DUF4177 domain-containing protein [Candidatus Bathycorpusculum sp.]|jgi:hypothetical protein|uniref:DUF4177 domain-containing protein n=1 Tax=Candidatus Bathycorpusculum sp. TaxID=2994959 RepID=UPI0028242C25|nr:DUF4177 domain-containing protein [Candidatus Termitimicrobium sp.]MCL2685697.1 DUF4177 domain-containing protein [Candidatus Termitimicrobium sp.]
MFEYKSEVLVTTIKWVNDRANETDVSRLDDLINKRTEEGWEFVTYSYMANTAGIRSAILITFRKEK